MVHLRVEQDQAQDVVSAEYDQQVELRTDRDRFLLAGPAATPRLAIVGFEPGSRVPVGLYRLQSDGKAAGRLVRQIGLVTVPQSRVAVFDVPPDVLDEIRGDGVYCLTVPLDSTEESDCPVVGVRSAPPAPGSGGPL